MACSLFGEEMRGRRVFFIGLIGPSGLRVPNGSKCGGRVIAREATIRQGRRWAETHFVSLSDGLEISIARSWIMTQTAADLSSILWEQGNRFNVLISLLEMEKWRSSFIDCLQRKGTLGMTSWPVCA